MKKRTLRLLFAQALALSAGGCFLGASSKCHSDRVVDDEVVPRAGLSPLDSGVDPLTPWLTRTCEESCATFRTTGSEALTSCRAPQKQASGMYVLHCEWSVTTCDRSGGGDAHHHHGRRPPGFEAQGEVPASRWSVGDFLASMAELEGASVPAFGLLKRDLTRLGAPRGLVRAAGRAARDEMRHARVASALARSYARRVPPLHVPESAPRDAEPLALENTVEGCVRETYGALLAAWSAKHARDPRVRGAMKRIARDEMEHAALSWRVASFLEQKLDAAARKRVRAAREKAIRALFAAAESPVAPALNVEGLHPSPPEAYALLRTLESRLWSA